MLPVVNWTEVTAVVDVKIYVVDGVTETKLFVAVGVIDVAVRLIATFGSSNLGCSICEPHPESPRPKTSARITVKLFTVEPMYPFLLQ